MAIGEGWADGAWVDAGWVTTGDGAWAQAGGGGGGGGGPGTPGYERPHRRQRRGWGFGFAALLVLVLAGCKTTGEQYALELLRAEATEDVQKEEARESCRAIDLLLGGIDGCIRHHRDLP